MLTCLFEDGNKAFLRHAVVDTLVVKDDKLLMVKRTGKILEGGKWGLVGGYAERDETLKEAVSREILEETGYAVRNITLLTINDRPDRPHEDRQNIAFVFVCEALEKTGSSDWETDDLRWFGFDELPAENEIAFDHFKNIQTYLEFKKSDISPVILG